MWVRFIESRGSLRRELHEPKGVLLNNKRRRRERLKDIRRKARIIAQALQKAEIQPDEQLEYRRYYLLLAVRKFGDRRMRYGVWLPQPRGANVWRLSVTFNGEVVYLTEGGELVYSADFLLREPEWIATNPRLWPWRDDAELEEVAEALNHLCDKCIAKML